MNPSPENRQREYLRSFRRKVRAEHKKRHEILVPYDLTRTEAKILQSWIPEIVDDIRAQLRAQQQET